MEALPPLLRSMRSPIRPPLHNLQTNVQSGFSSSSTASVSRAFSSAVSSSSVFPSVSSSVSSSSLHAHHTAGASWPSTSVRPGPSIRASSSTCTLTSAGGCTLTSDGTTTRSVSTSGSSLGGLFSSTPPRLGRIGRLQQSAQADVFDNPANDCHRVARRAAYPWQKELER